MTIWALPMMRFSDASTSASNALMRAFDLDWRALGDCRIHSSSSLIAFCRPSSSRLSCSIRFAFFSR
jgi:hypothetical protein